MTCDNDYCDLVLPAQLEFEWLCRQISDDRDPDVVAFAMTKEYATRLRELRDLWRMTE